MPRVVVEGITPQVDGGRFPAKRTAGDTVVVEANVFADGHELVAAALLWRETGAAEWNEAPMTPLGNDRFRGSFPADRVGFCEFAVRGWLDHFGTWRADLRKRYEAGQDLSVELRIGAQLIDAAAARATPADTRTLLANAVAALEAGDASAVALALSDRLGDVMRGLPRLERATTSAPLRLRVDRVRARCSAWYEFFPRSCSPEAGAHGTFADCETRLDYVASMGFNVVYLPPIHPIGRTFRKGRNNSLAPVPDDVGSPWAIGAAEGGHTAVHPSLGTLADFDRLVAAAGRRGLELALDIAFQCSPDHPWVREHRSWFRERPDGTIQYAENPPKKYNDIFPLDFESPDAESLRTALRDVVLFWIGHGVRIFRVDNPHTKPFALWDWLIAEVQAREPDVIFLAEAFTRPNVMYRLAKGGFTQSYTYFTWRNTKADLTEYFTRLSTGAEREFFRPNLWPNTPDILHEYLQTGGRPAFRVRLVLAATLGANYGIYGPAFELCDGEPVKPGSEEYLDSEKYQIRTWDLGRKDSLRELITRINQLRRDNPALQSDAGLRFHRTENPMLLCYSKAAADGANVVLVVVNLDPAHTQAGWLELDLAALGLTEDTAFQAHDGLSDSRYLWRGPRCYVELDPRSQPAHVFTVRRRQRTERDFDYFL